MPVCFLCGTLYMVSQLMKNKSILIVESKAIQFSQFDEDTSEDEVYYDADKEVTFFFNQSLLLSLILILIKFYLPSINC